MGQNTWREWAIVPTMDFLMEQRDIIGGRLCLGLTLGSNAGMTVGPALFHEEFQSGYNGPFPPSILTDIHKVYNYPPLTIPPIPPHTSHLYL